MREKIPPPWVNFIVHHHPTKDFIVPRLVGRKKYFKTTHHFTFAWAMISTRFKMEWVFWVKTASSQGMKEFFAPRGVVETVFSVVKKKLLKKFWSKFHHMSFSNFDLSLYEIEKKIGFTRKELPNICSRFGVYFPDFRRVWVWRPWLEVGFRAGLDFGWPNQPQLV